MPLDESGKNTYKIGTSVFKTWISKDEFNHKCSQKICTRTSCKNDEKIPFFEHLNLTSKKMQGRAQIFFLQNSRIQKILDLMWFSKSLVTAEYEQGPQTRYQQKA